MKMNWKPAIHVVVEVQLGRKKEVDMICTTKKLSSRKVNELKNEKSSVSIDNQMFEFGEKLKYRQ